MNKHELFGIILVCLISSATCQESAGNSDSKINNKDKPPDKIFLHKSQPYDQKEDQQSFMSKIVTWVLPFSERRDGGPQYLPVPPSQSHIEKDCNPCNREPWIPIASSVGEKTVINFVPPVNTFGHSTASFSDLSPLETLHPPPAAYNVPVRQYAPPPQFRPKDQNYITKYQQQPNFQKYPLVDYMVPPPVNYRIPSLIYGPPSQPNGPPPNPLYSPPSPFNKPPINTVYGRPPNNPPVNPLYGPPNQLNNPSVKPVYGPPDLPPVKPVYGPPSSSNNFPSGLYPPPKPLYQPVGPSGYNNQYLQQQLPQFITPPALGNNDPRNPGTTYLRPVAQNQRPPPIPIPDFPDQYSGFDEPVTDKNIQVFPSDSYGAPVTGDTLNYFSPHEQLLSANEQKEYLERPIPLPNLSSYPVLPFRNYGDFNQNRVGVHYGGTTEVKIQESVKVADYLAAIEHPIDVIQSPLIELSIKDDGFDGGNEKQYESNSGPENLNTVDSADDNGQSYNSQVIKEGTIYNREEKAQKPYGTSQEDLHDATSSKLSENPIVVEDIHAAASSNNNTFVNSNEVHIKRSNNKDLATPNQIEPVKGVNIIKELLLSHKTTNGDRGDNHLQINHNFTTPTLDYSSWRPTQGVTMPSFKVSQNIHSSPTVNPTTKKPKVLQIIVPYISTKKSGPFEKDWTYKNQKGLSPTINYNGAYTTLVPVFTPPSSADVSDWVKFMASEPRPVVVSVTPKATTGVYNIRDLLDNRTEQPFSGQLPFDIISLQKHIDDWTQQAYSMKTERVNERLSTPKEIPSGYFTTQSPDVYSDSTASGSNKLFNNFEDAEKRKKLDIKTEHSDIETNLVQPVETTTEKRITTTTKTESLWNVSHVTVFPQTKEKVYVVTPQLYNFFTSTPATAWSTAPKVENGKINNGSTYDSYKFSIRVEPQNKTSKENLKRKGKDVVKIVYSEWPHLINNLQTTTKKPASRHPLFGFMDIPYTPTPNSTVETIFGHSKVTSAVTSTVPDASVQETTTSSVTDGFK